MEAMPLTDEQTAARRRNRWQLGMVLVVFLGPVLVAVLLYANADRWLGGGPTGQHGQLYQPAKPLESVPFEPVGGVSMTLDDLRGQWTVVVLGDSACGAGCRDVLYKVRQAHKAQGKNIGRVQRVFVALGGAPGEGTRDFLAAEHPKLIPARPTRGQTSLAPFRHPDAEGLPGVYVLDPHANLVMRYGQDFPAKGLIKDLESLLKHSTIG